MSETLCWVALKDRDLDSVLGQLNYRRTGQEGYPAEHSVVARQDDCGWTIVVASDWEDPIVAPPSLARLSQTGEVLACQMDAPLLSCCVTAWRHGERCWWVEHDANRGLDHLDSGGEIPDAYRVGQLRKNSGTPEGCAGEAPARRIPLRVAAAFVGQRDEILPGIGASARFEALVALEESRSRIAAARRRQPWWRVW